MRPEERTTVLLVGGRDPAEIEKAFKVRGLQLEACDLSDMDAGLAPKRFAHVRAILVAEPLGRFRTLRDTFERIGPLAVVQGVALAYLAHAPADLKRVSALLNKMPALQAWEKGPRWVYAGDEVDNLAELLRQHSPGPGSGEATVNVRGKQFMLREDHRQLLVRAFWDAKEIVVESLVGGATSPGAYRVHASLNSRYGLQEPTPFVFKINTPQKNDEECNSYREFVQPFVPFHLRPNLIEARCVQTPAHAALTCNFVEGATPLEAALVNGQGAGTLFSLFEVTLRRFRDQTHSSEPRPGLLVDYIRDKVKIALLRDDEARRARIKLAQKRGLNGEPEKLLEAICERAQHLRAVPVVIHGDLHLGNVMARHRDAIVIDFGSIQHEGPVTADPAALEVSIAFGIRKDEDVDNQASWFKLVDQLYLHPLDLPSFMPDHLEFAWINRALRETRHIVRCSNASDNEVLVILAASLLRYSRFPCPPFLPTELRKISEERKAYAMVKAQQVLSNPYLNASPSHPFSRPGYQP